MTAELMLYTLAKANLVLQADLGTNPFRWFDTQLPQGIFAKGKSCVRVRRISTGPSYNQGGSTPLNTVRFQIDILDTIAQTARKVAQDVADFVNSVDLASGAQFGSPATSPGQYPSFQLNQRQTIDAQLQVETFVITQDWRVYVNEQIV